MTDPSGDSDRTQLVVEGRPVLEYTLDRQERPTADGAVALAEVDTATSAVFDELAGWWLSTDDGELVVSLLAAGATTVRHAHVYSRPLTAADTAARRPDLPVGLTWSAIDRGPAELAAVLVEAYGPDHVDNVAGPDAEAPDLAALLDGKLVGPLLADQGGLIVDAEGQVLAVVIVNRGAGEPPVGGPWLTELFRRPGPDHAGLGRLALERAIASLAEAGEPALGLAVTEGNPARELYERMGFRHVSSSHKLAIP